MKFELLVKLSLLAAYFAALIWIGFKCRRGAGSVDGFVLGGRSVGAWLTAFAYGTSYFSAVVFVGYAGQFGWKYGISSTWVGIGNALVGSLLAWIILGRRTRLLTQHLDSATMPDFFAKRFDSSSLKLAASAIIFVFLIPYTASLYNGLSRLFSMAFPGFSYSPLEALKEIDWNVIMMIVGTMGTVYLFIESKMPQLMADVLVDKTPSVKWAVLSLSLFAGFISAFVDNVATVLMIAPVALAMCKKLNISPVAPIICIAVSSNLQGAATLVGDTTSILLAKAANLDFLDFFVDEGRMGMFFVVELGALMSGTSAASSVLSGI